MRSVILVYIVLLALVGLESQYVSSVTVFHLIDQKQFGETDGSVLEGKFSCPDSLACDIVSTDVGVSGRELMPNLVKKYEAYSRTKSDDAKDVTVGLYSIHSWGPGSDWPHHPDWCSLPTTLSMVESEESHQRFNRLFSASFAGYDGNSTTHPSSTVQRSYMKELTSAELLPTVPHESKLPAAAYVASTCHGHAKHVPRREAIVSHLEGSFRVDSLGSCHRTRSTTNNPGQLRSKLPTGATAEEALSLKRALLSQYLFYLAFENTIEPGYVTEKVFDALKAGTVPVYLGDSDTCRKLLPHPDAAIFVDDYVSHSEAVGSPKFLHGMQELASYLQKLTRDSNAYSRHTEWRGSFDPSQLGPMLKVPWPCRVCQWAMDAYLANESSIERRERERGVSCKSLRITL